MRLFVNGGQLSKFQRFILASWSLEKFNVELKSY